VTGCDAGADDVSTTLYTSIRIQSGAINHGGDTDRVKLVAQNGNVAGAADDIIQLYCDRWRRPSWDENEREAIGHEQSLRRHLVDLSPVDWTTAWEQFVAPGLRHITTRDHVTAPAYSSKR